MNEGWIQLHRELLDSEIFASEKGLKIWVWMLLKANHKQKHVNLAIGKGESIVTVHRGEFIFGRFVAEEELCINGSTIYKWMQKMEKMDMISLVSNNHYTAVTICNYNKYNVLDDVKVTANEQPIDSKRTTGKQQKNIRVTTDKQQANTTNNDNNDNNGKNDKKSIKSIENILADFKTHYRAEWNKAVEAKNAETDPEKAYQLKKAVDFLTKISRYIVDNELNFVASMQGQFTLKGILQNKELLDVELVESKLLGIETSDLMRKKKAATLNLTVMNWIKRDNK